MEEGGNTNNNNNSKRMTGDPVFKASGLKPGIEIWRVESFKLVPYPEKMFGKFYEGDSYVILKTEGKGGNKYHIHFWLGKSTSKDEAGTAAVKAVELDDLLGSSPVQYREIQAHESGKFLSYFPKGVQYLDGGAASGFRHVTDTHEKRLLQVKGRKRPRVTRVPLTSESLNRGDIFILDNGSKIWVWCGFDSNRAERVKGMEFARQIRDELRGGKAHINIVEDNPNHRPQKGDKLDPLSQFFTELGSSGRIKTSSEGGVDEKAERQKVNWTLHRVSDASGQLRIAEVAVGKIDYKLLDSQDVFILDQGGSHIYVWVGKKSTKEEKLNAMKLAVNFLRTKSYCDWTPVTRVVEGAEPPLFQQCFFNWPLQVATGFNQTFTSGRGIAHVQQVKVDAAKLHERRKRDEQMLFDDGHGQTEVWRVENFQLVPLDKSLYGTFFGGDSYVILYTYTKHGKQNFVIYYWLGRLSSTDEKGSAAMFAVQMDDKLGGAPVQVRVIQGKEPKHFLKIFKGKLIVYKGGTASGFRGYQQELQQKGGAHMFRIRTDGESETRAIEVEPIAASLNSNDVFVLCGPKSGYLWCGKGSCGDERELAKEIAGRVAPQFRGDWQIILETKEPDQFWNLLRGKTAYASGGRLDLEENDRPPRLFHCSNATGRFDVEEIFGFNQDDLDEDDIMMLDAYDVVFLWIGKDANPAEKKESLRLVKEYVETDPSGRDADDTQLIVVKQDNEPLMFTGLFPFWDAQKGASSKSYEQLKNELADENSKVTLVEEELRKFSFDKKYPYKVLKGTESVPDGVDPTQKEYHLTPEEFSVVFGMTLGQYNDLPQWKRDNLKRRVDLF